MKYSGNKASLSANAVAFSNSANFGGHFEMPGPLRSGPRANGWGEVARAGRHVNAIAFPNSINWFTYSGIANVLKEGNRNYMGVDTEVAKVKSGVPGLDQMLKGGFPQGSVVLVAGESGAGKSTFGMQFLYSGATQYKEAGMLISFEETKEDISKNMSAFGWDLDGVERSKKIVVLEYPPQEVGHFMAQEVIIHDAIEEYGVKRVVIDSITTFALLYETEHKQREEVLKLVNKLKRWGCTVIMTSEVEEEAKGDIKARFGLETICDGVVYLYNNRKGSARARELEIYKMRGTAHDTNVVPMKFTNSGISL